MPCHLVHSNATRMHKYFAALTLWLLSFRFVCQVNRYVDNIGARRLHTVLERVLDEVSFNASEQGRKAREEDGRECHIVIDKEDVHKRVGHLVDQTDLSRFIL